MAANRTFGGCSPYWKNEYWEVFGKTYVILATSTYNYVGKAFFNYYVWNDSRKRYEVADSATQSNSRVRNVWNVNGRWTPHGTNNEECYHTFDFGGIPLIRIGSFGYHPEIGSVSGHTICWYVVVL